MKINIYQPRLEHWLDFFHGWCSGHFFLEVEVIYLQISNAAWTSSLGKAVAIRILFPRYPLAKEIYLSSSSQYLCKEVVGSCFLVSDFFMETVPERCRCTNRMKNTKLSFEFISAAHVQMFGTKRTQRRVRNPLINSKDYEPDAASVLFTSWEA